MKNFQMNTILEKKFYTILFLIVKLSITMLDIDK
jgi:hypothetical protein